MNMSPIIILKTTTPQFDAIQNRVKELHSYEVPEIISFPVARGLPQYLEWVTWKPAGRLAA